MMLAGFEVPIHCSILLAGRFIENMPPHKRDIGMVFQSYALSPHVTAQENLACPLKVRKLGKPEAVARVKRALDIIRFVAYADVGLLNAYTGLILADTTLATPFVVITVTATLMGFDHSRTRAAAGLGASRSPSSSRSPCRSSYPA
ncbi:hypothetical protein ABIF97_004121 [Bradyrhizobium japonicum]